MSKNNGIDNEARKRMGLPLVEETNDGGGNEGGGEGGSGEGSGSDGGNEGGGTGAGGNEGGGTGNAGGGSPELSDEELLALVQKRNPNIKSLEDLNTPPTPPDPKEAAKKKASAVLRHALKAEIITTEEHENYIRDSAKDARTIVFEDYAAKRRTANPSISDEQIAREFQKLYHENIDVADMGQQVDEDAATIKAARQEEMASQARRILKNKYPKMQNLEKIYDEEVARVNREKETNQNIANTINQYKADLDEIISSNRKTTYTIGDKQSGNDETFDFEFAQEDLDEVKKEFLTKEGMLPFIANYDKSVVQDAIRLRLLERTDAKRIAHISKKVADKEVSKLKMGRNHMNADEVGGSGGGNDFIDHEARQRLGITEPAQ